MVKRADLGIFIDAVLAMVEPVQTHFMWRPQLRDPADEMVLEAAVNGQAAAIVTFPVDGGRLGVREQVLHEIAGTVRHLISSSRDNPKRRAANAVIVSILKRAS
jgi:predicted nucleic acid-binding protein